MPNGLMKPVSFGSNITFNSGNLFSTNFTIDTARAMLRLTTLSDGTVHDSDYAAQSQMELPVTRRAACYLRNASAATVAAAYQAICDEVGKKATLTAVDANSQQWTCSARLEQIQAESNQPISTQTYFPFTMTFVQIDDWTEV